MEKRGSKNNISWAQVLFDWADMHDLPDLEWFNESDDESPGMGFYHGFPRNELNLDWHDLTELPEELGNLKQLTKLSFNKSPCGWQVRPKPKTSNILRCIPKWVYGLRDLKELCFSGNSIAEISSDIAKLNKLEVLGLDENSISTIPDTISQCLNLEWLGLRSNQLRAIPESLFECTKLESLLLESNEIECIPKGLSKLESLSTLELARNNLTAYPEDISLLENLNYLTLLGNKFIDLPTGPLNLKNLEIFDMLNFEYTVARRFGDPVLH